MRNRSGLSRKLNNIIFFLSGVLVMALIGIGALEYKTKIAADTTDTGDDSYVVPNAQTSTEKWQEGDILYNGEYYRYNNEIRSYLLMGIDSNDPVEEAEDGLSGGQSDALFLLVVDDENQEMSVVSINRNTMTEVDFYDVSGNYMFSQDAQICVQHAYGDGKKLSCIRTTDAVSKLFDNIPISGYIAINMGAIPLLNDAIGGVEVTVLQDVIYTDQGVELYEGETKTLKGKEAYCYLRGRDVTEFDSATDRLRRQEQYIMAYLTKLKAKAGEDTSYVMSVYNSAADYMVCSVDFSSLLEEVMGYDLNEAVMYTVPGETITENSYEEYHIDDEAMEKMIMSIFYVPVEEKGENSK